MTKQEHVSTIINLAGREDPTQRFHPRFIEAICDRVLTDMYNELLRTKPRQLGLYVKYYGETNAIQVLLDSVSGTYYSTLPESIIEVNDKASGVRAILPRVNTGNTFVPMSLQEADMIFGTDMAVVTQKIGYKVRQDGKVDYFNMNSTVADAGVRMGLIIPFSKYTNTDNVMIPEVEKSAPFLERVLTLLQVVRPVDLVDDNSGEQVKKQ